MNQKEAFNFDGETQTGLKNIKAATLWGKKKELVVGHGAGYFEMSAAFLLHYRCCLKLDHTQAMFLQQLLRFRSLSLRQAKTLQSKGEKVPKALEKGLAYVGKQALALALDVTPEHVRQMSQKLEKLGLLKRFERRKPGQKSLSNFWDLRPLFETLASHVRSHAVDWPKNERNLLPCPCHTRREEYEAKFTKSDLSDFDSIVD